MAWPFSGNADKNRDADADLTEERLKIMANIAIEQVPLPEEGELSEDDAWTISPSPTRARMNSVGSVPTVAATLAPAAVPQSTTVDTSGLERLISSRLDMVEDVLRMVEVRLDSPAGSPVSEGDGHSGGLDAESGEIPMQGGDMIVTASGEVIPASGSDRFDKLSSGTIDVLIRTTTWTTSRDADLNADFAGMNFFDGQGILVREDAFSAAEAGNSAAGLNNANICVGVGTTTEGNMQDWFSSRNIDFNSIGTADAAEATDKLISGECDAFTGDMSAMVAKKWALDNDGSIEGGTWIASELMSKEPLGAATRDGDSDFKDVVAWVWYGMVTAEEMGVTAANAADMAASACALNEGGATTDPGMCRLLTSDLGLGTTDNPLAGTWMQAVLAASGNYGEAYDLSLIHI